VSASGKRWKARISIGSKNYSLGNFDTKQEAALAYDRKARQCGKDFTTTSRKPEPLNYKTIKAAEEAAVQATSGGESCL
jgi:hypothetical protein